MATMNFGGSVAAQAIDVPAAPVDPVRYFPDPALEAAVRTAVSVPVGDIHQSDLDLVTSFTANSLGIVDLTGMEYWTTLAYLALQENSIIDVSDLAGLISLTQLFLSFNSIVDISALVSLTNLNRLDATSNFIEDISVIASLTNISTLNLLTNSITDCTALSGLVLTLANLDIRGNTFSSEDSWDVLYDLEDSGCSISYDADPDPALNAPNASSVFNDAALIAAIQTATSKTWFRQTDLNLITTFFSAASTGVVDLSGMELWVTLTNLQLEINSISDISALSTLTNLTLLYLSNNAGIVDISALSTLTALETLALQVNSIVDISALSTLTALTLLQLEDNDIVDISPIAMTSGLLLLTGNPLNVAAYSTFIPALQLAGVTVDFTAEPTPTVIGIDPVSGTTAGGTPVTITGANFLDGATATIDGEPCTDVVFVDSTSLTAVTPAGTAGAKDVVVINDVETGTLVEGYEYT